MDRTTYSKSQGMDRATTRGGLLPHTIPVELQLFLCVLIQDGESMETTR